MVSTRVTITTMLVVLIGACGEPATEPEAEIRAWLQTAEEYAETEDRRGLVDLIAPAYSDTRGNRRDDIGNMLRVYFLRLDDVKLVTRVSDIRLYDDTAATVSLTAGMAAGNEGRFGFSADAYDFELELARMDGEWRLLSARWGETGRELR